MYVFALAKQTADMLATFYTPGACRLSRLLDKKRKVQIQIMSAIVHQSSSTSPAPRMARTVT